MLHRQLGFGITFDSQGGAPVDPVAVGFRADRTKIGNDFISNNVGWNINPITTRPGYKFIGWFNDPDDYKSGGTQVII